MDANDMPRTDPTPSKLKEEARPLSPDVEKILKVLTDETREKRKKLRHFIELIKEWNSRVNLVSRKDIEHLETRHLLHSLAVAKFIKFKAGDRVLDVGTGGGFPGLPLAICFPKTSFTLLDSIQKKVVSVRHMASALGLKNVRVVRMRVEDFNGKFSYVLGRAVTAIPRFVKWTGKNLEPGGEENCPHGILYFKGSLFHEELDSITLSPHAVYDLKPLSKDPFFEEKYLLHLAAKDILK